MNKIKMFDVERDFCKENRIAIRSAVDNNNRLMNIQPINEKLLRMAVKTTDEYATDIIILLNNLDYYFIEREVAEIDIYFRNMGIDWILDSRTDKQYKPDKYRAKAKLVFDKSSEALTLSYGRGNC
jgi:hypothetical protein